MDEYTRAIRQAQNLLRNRAKRFRDEEVGYHQFQESPFKGAYNEAANELEALIVTEENS